MNLEISGNGNYNSISGIEYNPWNNDEENSDQEEEFENFMSKIEGEKFEFEKSENKDICSKKIHEEYLENYEFI